MITPLPRTYVPAVTGTMRQRVLASLIAQVGLWWGRGRQRRALARFSDRQLKDIGLTRAHVVRETAKFFWQP